MRPEPWYDWIFFAIVGIPWVLGFVVLFLERSPAHSTAAGNLRGVPAYPSIAASRATRR